MKFLRILVITISLNVPFAYAMQESNISSKFITVAAKTALFVGGTIVLSDGLSRVVDKPIWAPVIKVSDNQSVNDAWNVAIGCTEILAGWIVAVELN